MGERGLLLVVCTNCVRVHCHLEGASQFSVAKPSCRFRASLPPQALLCTHSMGLPFAKTVASSTCFPWECRGGRNWGKNALHSM